MRWKGGRKSSNVEDRRGQSARMGGGAGSGLLSFLPMLVRTKTGRIMLLIGVVVIFRQPHDGYRSAAVVAGRWRNRSYQ